MLEIFSEKNIFHCQLKIILSFFATLTIVYHAYKIVFDCGFQVHKNKPESNSCEKAFRFVVFASFYSIGMILSRRIPREPFIRM